MIIVRIVLRGLAIVCVLLGVLFLVAAAWGGILVNLRFAFGANVLNNLSSFNSGLSGIFETNGVMAAIFFACAFVLSMLGKAATTKNS